MQCDDPIISEDSNKLTLYTFRPSSRVATAERKLKLVNDSQAKSYGVHNVVCDLCDTDVPLEGDGDYNLTSWESHKLQCSL